MDALSSFDLHNVPVFTREHHARILFPQNPEFILLEWCRNSKRLFAKGQRLRIFEKKRISTPKRIFENIRARQCSVRKTGIQHPGSIFLVFSWNDVLELLRVPFLNYCPATITKKKFLAQEARQKSDISERRSKG